MPFAQGTEVHFATGEWTPYTSDKMPGFGPVAEVVTAACAASGLTASYEFVPWKRAEQEVVDGNVFAAFPYFIIPARTARPDIYAYSDSLFSSVYCVLYYKKNPRTPRPAKFERAEDLRGYTVGVLAGSPIVTTVLDKAGIKYEETTDVEASVAKLVLGRVDFVIEERAVVWEVVKTAFPGQLGDFAFLDRTFTPRQTTHLLVSRKFPRSDALLAKFNEGLRKIKADGTLRAIYDRYGLPQER
jgi:polar amino acid transport system substrate-binding protein